MKHGVIRPNYLAEKNLWTSPPRNNADPVAVTISTAAEKTSIHAARLYKAEPGALLLAIDRRYLS